MTDDNKTILSGVKQENKSEFLRFTLQVNKKVFERGTY